MADTTLDDRAFGHHTQHHGRPPMGSRSERTALTTGVSLLPSRGRALAAAVSLVLAAGALGACGSTGSGAAAAGTPVPISGFRDVAGRWAGPLNGLPGPRRDEDWIQVTIGEDGTCAFTSARTIGVFGGKGQCALESGKVVMRGERGSAAFTLLEGAGGRRLRGDGVVSGAPITSDLSPAR
jgi:hypothetical protein